MTPAMLSLATGALACACFGCFTWGTAAHFRRVTKQSAGAWAISLLSLAGFGIFLWRLATGGVSAAWPLAWLLFAISFTFWVWTIRTTQATPPTLAFTQDAPSLLFARGPYRLVRHPFYLSYLVFWGATCLPLPGSAAANIAGVGPFLVMAGVYLVAARHEEHKFARSDLAASYRDYAGATGMFLPRLRSVLGGTRAQTG